MKLNKIFSIALVLAGGIIMATGCEKDKLDGLVKWEPYDPATSANIRLLHAYAWLSPAVTVTSPSLASGQHFYFYRDTFKLNGNPISYGGNWPGPSVYSLQPAGSYDFRLVLARQATVNGVVVPKPNAGDTFITKKLTLEAGKYYSAFITDTLPNKDLWMIEDKINPVYDTAYYIRLAHLLVNNKDTLNVFSRRENRNIISDITYKTASEFVRLRVPTSADTFEIIRRGPGTNPYTVTGTSPTNRVNTFVGTPGRYYTLIARGNPRVAGRAAAVGFYTNR